LIRATNLELPVNDQYRLDVTFYAAHNGERTQGRARDGKRY
jgi:hypothetical protein